MKAIEKAGFAFCDMIEDAFSNPKLSRAAFVDLTPLILEAVIYLENIPESEYSAKLLERLTDITNFDNLSDIQQGNYSKPDRSEDIPPQETISLGENVVAFPKFRV